MSLLGRIVAVFRRRPPVPTSPPAPDLGVIHWVPPTMRTPICGRDLGPRDRWTSGGSLSTCPACRVEWSKIGLKKFLNER